MGGSGLIGGSVAGEVLSGMALWRCVRAQDFALIRRSFCLRGLRAAALEFRDFVIYSAPQNLLNALSQGAPVLLLIHFYGAAVGGLYAFSVRVLETPMNFVLTSVRQVLYQNLSEAYNRRDDVVSLFVKSTTTLAAIAAGPAMLGLAVMPWLFGRVFGREWDAAGQYARWLILWFVPAFCNVPAMLLARILRKQRELLIFDVVLLGARVAVLGFGGYYLTAAQSIMAFSLLGCLFNTLLILYVWRVAVRERQVINEGRIA
jgi:O-antigen/teichoic acid export membrane protein